MFGLNSDFNTTYDVVAPLASDNTDPTSGTVSYAVFDITNNNSTQTIDQVSLYISRQVGRRFYGSFMIVAEWRNITESSGISANVSLVK